jgi:exonuclease SbcC
VAEAGDALRTARDAAAELALVEDERKQLRAEIATIEPRLDALRSDRNELARNLAQTQSRRTDIAARIEKHRADSATVADRVAAIEARLDAARRLSDAEAEVSRAAATLATAEAVLAAQLVEQRFPDADTARTARRTHDQIAAIEKRLRHHDEARATAQATLAEPQIAGAPSELVDVEPARIARAVALDERDAAIARASALRQRVDQLDGVVGAARDHRAATGQRRLEFEQLRQLASVVRGDEPNTRRMRLETFVLAAQLEEIVAAANTRLRTMSAGRYALEHDDALQYRNAKSGLGLAIRDEHTGRSRPTHSLSGGETFLASLALALGLAEVVTNQAGGITLDTLFIDEGFGSLDGDTLDIAMSTLDGLGEGGRTIGLISHVEAMKEQIPAKLRITVSPRGDSSVHASYEHASYEHASYEA